MAAEHLFIYTGGDRDDIPIDVTHVTIDESVTAIPEKLFYEHPNIVELICHKGVTRIGRHACFKCPSLERVIMLGVLVVEYQAFCWCEVLLHVECDKVERLETSAFYGDISLQYIELPCAEIVESGVFHYCKAMKYARFSKALKTMDCCAFGDCVSLERISIPLKKNF